MQINALSAYYLIVSCTSYSTRYVKGFRNSKTQDTHARTHARTQGLRHIDMHMQRTVTEIEKLAATKLCPPRKQVYSPLLNIKESQDVTPCGLVNSYVLFVKVSLCQYIHQCKNSNSTNV
jgi:hypothetical protein